jgi:hypothetical protein
VLREDPSNENLLFLGCEFSAWYSIDRGKTWTRIQGGLPTVAVHEFAIHDDRHEVVAATHGRSLWIADISILRQLTPETLAADLFLYQPRDAIKWGRQPSRGDSGTRRFVGDNPDNGTRIAYSLGKNAQNVTLNLYDLRGDLVKTFETSTRKGFYQIDWNLSRDNSPGGRRSRAVPNGSYLLVLKVDGERKEKIVEVRPDPASPNADPTAFEELELSFDQD